MRRKAALVLSLIILLISVLSPITSYAQVVPWPQLDDVEADGACLMDMATGTVLFGKNMHEKYYPASITKILTALIVIENCDLEEEFTFSHRAIYDVEENSQNAAYDIDGKFV